MNNKLEDKKDKFLNLIKKNGNIEKIKQIILENSINLRDFNNKNFDLLIYLIINDASVEIVKFIIEECNYKTLNYVFVDNQFNNSNGNRYLFFRYHFVPLFFAILKQNFRVADLLIKNKADINFFITDSEGKKYNIIQYLFFFSLLDIVKLNYIIDNGFKVKGITSDLIIDLIKSNHYSKTDVLENIFKCFIFDNRFILNLLSMYKHKISISDNQLQSIIKEEKNKIPINDYMYDNVIYEKNYDILTLLLECDGSSPDEILRKIYKYEILENAVETCRFNSNIKLIKKILNIKSLNFECINMDIIIVEACKKKNVKIMKLLIEALLNHPEYDLENIDFEEILIQVINEEEKIDVMQFLIETLLKLKTFNCKYINFENILTEVCRRDNTSVIKLIIETLISEKLFDVEYIDVENILLESIKESNVETVKLLIETILYEKIIDFSSFNIENILLEVCRRSNSEIMKLIIDILLNNESINLKNIDFENILIETCKEYNSDILQLLFDLIFNHKNIDSNCINLENVLIKSSQISHVDIFLILIEKLNFYSFNIKNLPLEKILPVANHKNYKKDNLKLFLEKLLNISLESSDGMDVTLIKNWKDTYLNVLINLIIEMNNLHLLKHILENSDVNNININIKDIYNKYPIVVAYEAIDYYKSEYISSKNNSLIHYYNSVEIFHFLLDYGANCDINNLNGISLLSQALNKKYYNVVKYLLKYKSFIGKKKINEANNSPKIKNAYKNIMNSVKLLSITEEDKKESEEIEYNFTLLVSSYLLNYKEAFKLLLKNSNVNEIDQCGLTLLHYSILKEDIEMVKFLIDNCADISIDNYSALLISICIENKDIFNLLVDNINFILDEKNTLKDQILMSLLKCFSFSIDEKINMLKTLSKKGYRFNNINPYKNSPLVYAIQIDSISLVQFLIKNDININDIDENGKSPLIYAIQKKSIELVTLLIENGANVNVMINNERNTSMSNLTLTLNSSNSLSSSNSNTDTDSENENSDNSHNSESHDSMISSNNSNNNLPVKYKNSQYSPLMYAIQEESIPLVELLINHGADVNYVSHNGISPLICAIQKNSYPMVELLLSKGAHVNITDGLWEFSTLVYAIEENSLPIAKLLIENGANVNYGGGKLLRSAIEKKSLPMLQLLIENGTRINEIAILMYAVCRGELEIFKYLSKYTRNINFNDRYDSNSVIKSVDKSGRTEIFEYLVKNNVNEFTDKIIKNIIFNDKLELLKILIENNYNVNSKDDEGNTLLVYAIKNCNKPMVEYLIDHGANISNINNVGKSIIDISLQYSYDYWGEKNYKLIKNLINNNL